MLLRVQCSLQSKTYNGNLCLNPSFWKKGLKHMATFQNIFCGSWNIEYCFVILSNLFWQRYNINYIWFQKICFRSWVSISKYSTYLSIYLSIFLSIFLSIWIHAAPYQSSTFTVVYFSHYVGSWHLRSIFFGLLLWCSEGVQYAVWIVVYSAN